MRESEPLRLPDGWIDVPAGSGWFGYTIDPASVERHGITQDDYEALISRQGGRCAICQLHPSTVGPLQIDHDHRSGQVRGLLCARCNRGIGLFLDVPVLLEEPGVICANAVRGGRARSPSMNSNCSSTFRCLRRGATKVSFTYLTAPLVDGATPVRGRWHATLRDSCPEGDGPIAVATRVRRVTTSQMNWAGPRPSPSAAISTQCSRRSRRSSEQCRSSLPPRFPFLALGRRAAAGRERVKVLLRLLDDSPKLLALAVGHGRRVVAKELIRGTHDAPPVRDA